MYLSHPEKLDTKNMTVRVKLREQKHHLFRIIHDYVACIRDLKNVLNARYRPIEGPYLSNVLI